MSKRMGSLWVIFTLWGLGVASGQLFHVDIAIPQMEGRKEIDDITFIKSTLDKLTGINVTLARKAFDNRNVILVLEVKEICHLSTLTSGLSERGYQVTVSSLQCCSDTASEFGVDLTYHKIEDIQEANILKSSVVQYYDKGMNTDEYVDLLKKHFEKDKKAMAEGYKSVCFRKTGELPVTLLFFGAFATSELKDVYKEVRNEAKASIKMDLLQSLDMYTETC